MCLLVSELTQATHDRMEKVCTDITSRCPIQSLGKVSQRLVFDIGRYLQSTIFSSYHPFLCGISPHFVRSGESSVFIYLFVYESQVFVTWSQLGRERTLVMSVCVWWPLHYSGVVSWRIISTCFLAAISLQGKEKPSSLLRFVNCVERVLPAIIF